MTDYSSHSIEQLDELMKDVQRYIDGLEAEWIELAQAKAKKVGYKTQVQLNTLLSQ